VPGPGRMRRLGPHSRLRWGRTATVAGRIACLFATLCFIVAQGLGAPRPVSPRKNASGEKRVSLSPRFVAGETYRYEMEVETDTHTSRSGALADPQGPNTSSMVWDATIRIEVLAPVANSGGVRLRTTYEKSTATVRSDSFDPSAAETRDRYAKLQGKVVDFTLDAAGNVTAVSGLDGIPEDQSGLKAARQWIAQLDASAGAPAGGVGVGQSWTSQQPANSLPLAGFAWRSESQYLRNEPCRPANPDLSGTAAAAGSAAQSGAAQQCAVILSQLNLDRSKSASDMTAEDLRKRGVESSGKWTGSGQSLTYVSLANGLVVSATQTGTEEMDVTLTTSAKSSLHFAGTISSRSQVSLLPDMSASPK
jgi:hypothetical protein